MAAHSWTSIFPKSETDALQTLMDEIAATRARTRAKVADITQRVEALDRTLSETVRPAADVLVPRLKPRRERVHRRILFGAGNMKAGVQYAGAYRPLTEVYQPFAYAAPAPQAGATRIWRMYCVYTDAQRSGMGMNIQLGMLTGTLYFEFPITSGVVGDDLGPTRDAYSTNEFTDAQIEPHRQSHATCYVGFSSSNGCVYRLELHALDVWS